MNKRLRKKKHRGEFREMGFKMAFRTPTGLPAEERNHFLDRFIEEAVEANGLAFGGGGGPDEPWEGFVTLWNRGLATLKHREKVEQWLIREPLVVSYYLGVLIDAWYGHSPDETPQDGWIQKEI